MDSVEKVEEAINALEETTTEILGVISPHNAIVSVLVQKVTGIIEKELNEVLYPKPVQGTVSLADLSGSSTSVVLSEN